MMRYVNSSGGSSSRNGSPETKVTQEDARQRASNGRGLGAGHLIGTYANYPTTQGMANIADPFTGPSAAASGVMLSPTASSFIPANGSRKPAAIDASKEADIGPPRSTMSYLAATSEPDTPGCGQAFAGPDGEFGAIGQPRLVKPPVPMLYCQFGQFDNENRNRAFMIEGAPKDLAYLTVVNIFDRRQFGTLRGPVLTDLASHGVIYVGFSDLREATAAYEKVLRQYPDWRLQPLTAKEFASKFDASRVHLVSDFEGHIYASVFYNARNGGVDGRSVSHAFKNLIKTFGDIRAFKTIPTSQENVVDIFVEFFDTRVADNVVSTLNGSSVDGYVLDIKLHKPDVQEHIASFYAFVDQNEVLSPTSMSHTPAARRGPGFVHNSPFVELSPTGRSTIPIGDPAGAINWTPRSGDGLATRASRYDNGRAYDSRFNNQNHVDIDRIRMGVDVRTTIMLRNIPNKIDQAMLKDIVDDTSFGKYDFMYLRIDFANNCNVGYAFINFEDPIDIIDFATARAGRTWNCFNSDKIAEISYATIQGKDCLVQKFRNSSVMLEHPSFRPKIFHTGTGPLAGTEDHFPGPDNPSKMRRSVENAEHVGLFAPRVGQQYRDEQRRRRSQFDRGTISAERESCVARNNTVRRSPGYVGAANNMMSPTPVSTRSYYGNPFADNNRPM